VERRGDVTAGRGHGERGRPDVHADGETGVGQRHEQQRAAPAARQPRDRAAAHRPRAAGRLQHVAHQAGAELREHADRGRHQRAARAQRVVRRQRQFDEARDRVDGAPGRVASEQQPPRRRRVPVTRPKRYITPVAGRRDQTLQADGSEETGNRAGRLVFVRFILSNF